MNLATDHPTSKSGTDVLKPSFARAIRIPKERRIVRLRLSGLSKPLEFVNCPEIVDQFSLLMRGWKIEECKDVGSAQPLIQIEKSATDYHWRKAALPVPQDWNANPPHSTCSAVGHLHHELVHWVVAEKPGFLCLHCAAIESEHGLIVLLGRARAGKSTLTAELAAAGYRLFGDDVLLLDNTSQHGVSFGLLPRLRLPLPETMTARAKKFATDRRGLSDRRYQYIAMKSNELAPFGEQAPIASLVILDRVDSGNASLREVSIGDMLKTVIMQNCIDAVPATPTFDRLVEMSAKAQRFRLRYSIGLDAVKLLSGSFPAPRRSRKAKKC
jgi:hypothetical protein